jgi:hypothetical protein
MSDELTVRVARAMWQEESLRAGSRPRLIAWEDEHPDTRAKWCGLAAAAIDAIDEARWQPIESAPRDGTHE